MKKGVFVCGQCFSAEGLLTINGMISNTVVKGSMTRAQFLHYLEFAVVYLHYFVVSLHMPQPYIYFKMPLCSLFPGYLSVLVMDNVQIHHRDQILELADQFHLFL